ncbi:hypothetical protein ACNOYE_19370 [Nannocystaceae bacterium ST9]
MGLADHQAGPDTGRRAGTIDEHEHESRELIGVLALLASLDAAPLAARARIAGALAESAGREPIAALAQTIGVVLTRRANAGEREPSPRDAEVSRAIDRVEAEAEAEVDARESTAPTTSRASERSPKADDARRSEPPTQASSEPASERARRASETQTAWRDEPLDARVRASSEWGGLLLLLPIFRSERLWDRVAELAEPDAIDPRRLLHAFGRSLIPEPIAADDPALLAFVGLLPGAEFEALDPEPLRERLAALRATSITALERRLPVREHRPARGEALLAWLLRRHAELVGQPGWLELHFRLRDVDTDIRRAGLDLDPGWLPELGLVVKFVYV